MNFIVDIGHPAHVHLFRNLISMLKSNGHLVIVTTKQSEIIESLLEFYGIDFRIIGRKRDNIVLKGLNQVIYNKEIYNLVRKHHIEIAIGTSISIAHVSQISKMKSIVLDDDDDEVEPLFVNFGHRFADTILSPDCIHRKSKKNISYPSYHELAYIHPDLFSPDIEVLNDLGIDNKEKYFILRFVAFKGHHDLNAEGLSLNQKLELVKLLTQHGKVFITAERKIEPSLEKYRLVASPEKIHSLIYYAHMFFGDSQTMTSEAAMLGTPALKCNSFAGKLSVPNEIEKKYDLCYSFQPKDFDKMISKTRNLLLSPNLKNEWQVKTQRLLNEKNNLTEFLFKFIINYSKGGSFAHRKTKFNF